VLALASHAYLGKQSIASEPDRNFMIRRIDQLIDPLRQKCEFAADERLQEVIDIFQRARKAYQDMKN